MGERPANLHKIDIMYKQCFSHHLELVIAMALWLPIELEGITFIIADRHGTVEFPPIDEIVKQLKLK